MGIFDSIGDAVNQHKDKLGEAVSTHSDKIAEGIDKAGDFVDQRTGNKYEDQVDKGQELAKDQLGRLSSRRNGPK